jgi:hypothetical protein
MAGASAMVSALKFFKEDDLSIKSIQEYGANL